MKRSTRLALEWAVVAIFFAGVGGGAYLLITAGPSEDQAVRGGLMIVAGVITLIGGGIVKTYRPSKQRRKQVKKKTKSHRGDGGA